MAQVAKKPAFCRNVLTANLPQFALIGKFRFLQIGAEYDRFLDARGRFSLNGSIYYGVILSGQTTSGGYTASGDVLYYAPGFSYHFSDISQSVDLSVGIQVGLGYAGKDWRGYSASSSITAVMVQTDINFFPMNHGVIGLHFAVGGNQCDVLKEGTTSKIGPIVQIGLKIGGCF
jgi:hypothetical protein